jgi:hypothetical protein
MARNGYRCRTDAGLNAPADDCFALPDVAELTIELATWEWPRMSPIPATAGRSQSPKRERPNSVCRVPSLDETAALLGRPDHARIRLALQA